MPHTISHPQGRHPYTHKPSGLALVCRAAGALLSFGLLCAPAGAAGMYVPASDSVVVQTFSPSEREARLRRVQLRTARAQAPDLAQSATVAREAIERARAQGDPRELGLAQVALAPWWQQAAPPPVVRWLRATIRQSQHEFDAALIDYEAVARGAGTPLTLLAQAQMGRAAVLQVLGRPRDALALCEELAGPRYSPLGPAVGWAGQVCAAEARSLLGQARLARAELQALALRPVAREPARAAWLALVRAELAERMDDPQALALFSQATAQGPDAYALAAHADALLRRGRAEQVLQLVPADSRAEALMLRRAMAYHAMGDPAVEPLRQALIARFAAAAARGESLHRREEAMLALHLQGDASRALALAGAQWARQKEPADAVLLMQAARAAANAAAAEPVRRHVRDTGLQDARLRLTEGGPLT